MGRVGVIGLGLVGTAVIRVLSHAGIETVGYDVRRECEDGLHADGFIAARSPKDVAKACRRIVLCLPNSVIVHDLLFGGDGMVEALLSGDTIMDMTTGDPGAMAAMASKLGETSIAYLEVNVGGSSLELQERKALLMIGGPEDVFEAHKPFLELLSDNIFYMGESGKGAEAKLVYNLVLGLHRAVLAEGLNFGMAAGIDPDRLLELLRAGTTYSRVMDSKGQKMVGQDYDPVARLQQHLKDVRLILDMGHRLHTSLPMSGLHAQLLQIGVNHGFGELDNAAIMKVYRLLSGGE